MNHLANSLTRPLLNTTGAASATNWAPVDTLGFDYLSFDVSVVQATQAETSVEAIRISEIISERSPGTANPIPTLRLPAEPIAIAVLIPIKLPDVSVNAPPELPGLIAASV